MIVETYTEDSTSVEDSDAAVAAESDMVQPAVEVVSKIFSASMVPFGVLRHTAYLWRWQCSGKAYCLRQGQ